MTHLQDDEPVRAAGGIVVDGRGRVAIVHRPRRHDWSFPKGHLEQGETLRDAALREVREETGLQCTIAADAGDIEYVDRKGRNKRVHYYLMTIEGGAFEVNDEVDAIGWIEPTASNALTYPKDRALLDSLLTEFEAISDRVGEYSNR